MSANTQRLMRAMSTSQANTGNAYKQLLEQVGNDVEKDQNMAAFDYIQSRPESESGKEIAASEFDMSPTERYRKEMEAMLSSSDPAVRKLGESTYNQYQTQAQNQADNIAERESEAGVPVDSVIYDRIYGNYIDDVQKQQSIISSFGDMQALARDTNGKFNPQSDTALIYHAAKMVDPGGRISDADYRNWEASSIPAVIQSFINKMEKDGTLDDKSRQDLLEMGSRHYNQAVKSIGKKNKHWSSVAKDYGIPARHLYDVNNVSQPHEFVRNNAKGNITIGTGAGGLSDHLLNNVGFDKDKGKADRVWTPESGPKPGIFWAED